jgi:hypothetical protein
MKRLALTLVALALLSAPSQAQQSLQSVFRPLTPHKFNMTITDVTSATWAFGPFVRAARVLCSITCDVAFTARKAITAATNSVVLGANEKEYFHVSPGTHVQVRGGSASGIIYITEME